MNERKNCMTPECKRTAKSRGICSACFQSFLDAKNRGEVTDADAVAWGLVLPAWQERRGKFLSALRSKAREVKP